MHDSPEAYAQALDPDQITQASRALQAMAHPTRLKIVCLLAAGEMHVHDISEHIGSAQSNVSQHLAQLREKQVLVARRDANRIYYSINHPRTAELVLLVRNVFSGFATDDDARSS